MGILEAALSRATEIEIAAARRLAKNGEEGISTTFALMGFESPNRA